LADVFCLARYLTNSSSSSSSSSSILLGEQVVSTFLFSEGLLRTLADARLRLCVRRSGGCVVVPARARLVAAAVHSKHLLARTYAPRAWGGFDLR
jgi:hypothetical protein